LSVKWRSEEFRALFERTRHFVLGAALTGAVTGFAVAGFERLTVNVVFEDLVSKLPVVLLALAPGFGLAVATMWLRGPGRGLNRATADAYLDAFHKDHRLRVRDLANKLVPQSRHWVVAARWVSKDRPSTWALRSAPSASADSSASSAEPIETSSWLRAPRPASRRSSRLRDGSDLRDRSSISRRPRAPHVASGARGCRIRVSRARCRQRDCTTVSR